MNLTAPLNIPKRLKELDQLLAENRVEEARAKLKDLSEAFRMFSELLCAVADHARRETP